MGRPLSRAQREQNRAFLSELRRTGNVRLAAREVGLKYSTMQHRRRQHPCFAVQWDAALAFARARLNSGRKERASGNGLRTSGGEQVVVRLKDGSVQIRRAQPGKLTRECEQAFLAALSATCNVTLSAAAAGASPRAFYRRKKQCPAFAREMRLALQRGYEALELAMIEAGTVAAHEHDEWRHNDPPAMPPMTVNQALQLMYLHQKQARLVAEPDHLKRRRNEPNEAHVMRLIAMWEERERLAREEFEVAEAEARARGQRTPLQDAEEREARPDLFGLPDLAQVTGWSRADPDKAPHDASRGLFGGWRLEEMERDAERKRSLFNEDES